MEERERERCEFIVSSFNLMKNETWWYAHVQMVNNGKQKCVAMLLP
jgi:hypothetical protein